MLAMPAAMQALTASQVKETFAKYHAKENTVQVVLRPAPAAAAPAAK